MPASDSGSTLPVIVYGTVVVDRLRTLDAWPPKGGYGEYSSETMALGGEAANTAAALKSWGREVALLGNSVGDAPESDLLRRMLEERGLNSDFCDPAPGPTPTCDIYITPDGERTFFGRSWEVSPLPFPDWLAAWFTADPNHGDASRRTLHQASERGFRCYAMDFVRQDEQLPEGCVWQCSTDWFGERGNLQANRERLAQWCRRQRCQGILTDGAGDILVSDTDGRVQEYQTYSVGAPVDTTGSGDAFRAGMLLGLSGGWTFSQSLAFAAAAGALNTQGLGATTALPTLERVEALMRSQAEVTARFTC